MLNARLARANSFFEEKTSASEKHFKIHTSLY